MATITQTIPSLYQGISEAPDEQKLPGQVRNAVNVVPDIIDGLSKRPGLEFVKTLSNVSSDGCWFNYYRDENEGSYIGQTARDGTVRVWRCNDGQEMTITETSSPATYLTHTTDADIQALTINDSTFLCNRSKTVAMTSATAVTKPDQYSAYVELKQVLPRRMYALNIFSNTTLTTERSARAVTVYDTSFEITCNTEDCVVPINLTGSVIHVDGNTGIAVRVTVTGQPYIGDQDEHDDHTHIRYYATYTVSVELLHGGSYTNGSTGFHVPIRGRNHLIVITSYAETGYKTNLARIRPVPIDIDNNHSTDSAGVLSSIASQITNVSKTIIGNGIYLNNSSAFNVEALESDLFNIITDTVNNVGDLPRTCKNGYIVKVTNSAQLTEDDYYLKFIGDNNQDGSGHWEECAEPGIETTLDGATLPYILKRTGATTMTLEPYSWGIREVGDEETNKKPSFVGNKINQVLFHRDRLAFLSQSNLILSQPGNLGNFWNKTALTFSGVDRIDLSCSSSSPNALVDGIEMNTGLVLFSATAQYLFTTDSDILNPETAKIFTLSTYNYNVSVKPISLGTSIGFVDNAGKYSRFFEMLNIGREQQPEILEQSKIIQRLLPKDIDSVTNSRENSYVFACKRGTNTVTGLKYYTSGQKRLQNAWFIWNFAKNITHQFIINDEYYLVTSENELCKIQLVDTASRPFINQDGTDFNVHLDYYQTVSPETGMIYDPITDVTTVVLPADSAINTGDTVSVIVKEQNNNRGRYATTGAIPTTGEVVIGGVNLLPLPGQSSLNQLLLNGDWSSDPVQVGREYEMKVELPTIYPTTKKNNMVVSDTSASLILQRLKLNFGPIGQFITKLERKGKPTFIDTHESSIMDGYDANRAPNIDGSFRNIPVYERNTNVSVTITSTHPSPANIESLSWEGDYNNRYYKRI